ncbi:MAG: SDR family NAD(P)-dependent oxidoreductase [Saprospiraceae bacterium]
MSYALITGSSEGIGKALAIECARNGWNVLLVALPNEKLDETALEIAQQFPHLQVAKLGIDLTQTTAPRAIYDWVKEHHFAVQVLINNAGVGYAGVFETYASPAFFDVLINLNIRATTQITRLLLPILRNNQKGYILNVSSLGAFQPVPYQTVYGGTKAFIYYFSRALREELRDTNVSVSVVCPGGTNTNEINRARNQDLKSLAKMSISEPPYVAATAIRGMLRGKEVIIPGRINVLVRYISSLLPMSFRIRMAGKTLKPTKTYDKIQYAGDITDSE